MFGETGRRRPTRELQRSNDSRRPGAGDLRAPSTGGGFPQDAREQLRRAITRGLRVLELAARAGLPAHVRHPRRPRHGGQRRADGVREQGRRLGDRRLLHPRPLDRRAGRLRRVPRQRAGRGRRRRHPHAAAARRAARAHAARRTTSSSRRWARSSATTATCRTSSSRSRRGGSTSCRRAPRSARPRRRSSAPSTWRRKG